MQKKTSIHILIETLVISAVMVVGTVVGLGCSNTRVLRVQEIRAVADSVTVVNQHIADLQKSVDELNISQGGTSSKMRADLTLMLGDLKDQIGKLQSEIDETQYRLGQLSTKLEHLEQRKIVVGGDTSSALSGVQAGIANPATPGQGKTATTVKVVDGLDIEHVFNQAREDYVRGKYDLSFSGFKTVYEKDAGGSYKEVALYWMGECLFKGGKLDKALEMYERSIKEFPKGNKTCSARFKMGLIHQEAKDMDKRNEAWNNLIQLCPGTNEAARAEATMKE
jgi:TolA-binding protein